MFSKCLFSCLFAVLFVYIAPQFATANGEGRGGGDTIPQKALTPGSVVALLQYRILPTLYPVLSFIEAQRPHQSQYDQAKLILREKLHMRIFDRETTIYDAIPKVKFVYRNRCYDWSAESNTYIQVPMSTYRMRKFQICVDAKLLSEKLTEGDLESQLMALTLHEITHFFDESTTTHQEAILFQDDLFSSLQFTSVNEIQSQFNNFVFYVKGQMEELRQLKTMVNKLENPRPMICSFSIPNQLPKINNVLTSQSDWKTRTSALRIQDQALSYLWAQQIAYLQLYCINESFLKPLGVSKEDIGKMARVQGKTVTVGDLIKIGWIGESNPAGHPSLVNEPIVFPAPKMRRTLIAAIDNALSLGDKIWKIAVQNPLINTIMYDSKTMEMLPHRQATIGAQKNASLKMTCWLQKSRPNKATYTKLNLGFNDQHHVLPVYTGTIKDGFSNRLPGMEYLFVTPRKGKEGFTVITYQPRAAGQDEYVSINDLDYKASFSTGFGYRTRTIQCAKAE